MSDHDQMVLALLICSASFCAFGYCWGKGWLKRWRKS